jgi:hypothetical protein
LSLQNHDFSYIYITLLKLFDKIDKVNHPYNIVNVLIVYEFQIDLSILVYN